MEYNRTTFFTALFCTVLIFAYVCYNLYLTAVILLQLRAEVNDTFKLQLQHRHEQLLMDKQNETQNTDQHTRKNKQQLTIEKLP